MRFHLPLLVSCLLVLASCGGESEHFRAAQELIAAIEAGNDGQEPRYEDYRYEDVLVELAQVTPEDRDYWKAREWIQKIREGRDKAVAAAKSKVVKGEGGAKATSSAPGGFGSVAAAAATPGADLLEPHEHKGDADILLMGFRVTRDATALRITGDVINGSEGSLTPLVTVTVLAADGAELLRETGAVTMPFASNDRSDFAITIAAYDPNAPVDLTTEDMPAQQPSGVAFDPTTATRYRLEFNGENGPMTWRDDRFGRKDG